MKETFVQTADTLNREFLSSQASSGAFGYAEDDLSVEETRHVSCEAFRTATNMDIAIASESGTKNGITNNNGLAGVLFKGDIIGESLTVIIAATNINVVSITMTGKEIRELLEQGKPMQNADGVRASFQYWASGIEVVKKDGKITSIRLDGKELEDTATYTVAMLAGDYAEAFAASHEIIDTGINVLDALKRYFRAVGTVCSET